MPHVGRGTRLTPNTVRLYFWSQGAPHRVHVSLGRPAAAQWHLPGGPYRPHEVSGLALGEPFFGYRLSESGCEFDAQVPKVRQVLVRVFEYWFDQTRSPFPYLLGENDQIF